MDTKLKKFSLLLFIVLPSLLSCVPMNYQPERLDPYPTSRWGNSYRYTYDPVEFAEPKSVPLVVAVVNPSYRETDSALMVKAYNAVGKGFSASMGVDMDKVLVAKGMTTLGPYPTLDDIVYSSKKNAALTLAPKVFVTLDNEYTDEWTLYKGRTPTKAKELRMGRHFKMNVGGWVAFIMSEPLSGEKMWVKKLQFDAKEVTGIEYHNAEPQYKNSYGLFGEVTGQYISSYTVGNEILYDGKIEALADYLNEIYPVIMEKCWTYFDTEEMMHLKETSKEIRKLKRY